jgi:hypothetical protein
MVPVTDTEAHDPAAPLGLPSGVGPSGRAGAPPTQRVRITFSKGRPIRFIGHLDLARLWERAMRRERLPLAYTLGYTPHPRLVFAAPLALGSTGARELMDAYFTRSLDHLDLRRALDRQLPAGCEVIDLQEVPLTAASLQSSVRWASYRVEAIAAAPDAGRTEDLEPPALAFGSRWTRRVPDESSIPVPPVEQGKNEGTESGASPWRRPEEVPAHLPGLDSQAPVPTAEELDARIAGLLGAEAIPVVRSRGGTSVERDLRARVIDLWRAAADAGGEARPAGAPAPPLGPPPSVCIGMLLRLDPTGAGRPDEVTAALGLQARWIHRTRIGLEGERPSRG